LLTELSRSFSAVLNLPELLSRILDAALRLTPSQEARIALLDAETGEVTIHTATQGGEYREPTHADVSIDPLIPYVAAQRKPLLVRPGDSLRNFGLKQDADDSRLYVPLIAKEKTIGLLIAVAGDKAGPFGWQDQDVLAGLAGYAAIAIENALLYQQALDRTLELSLLVESADAVSSSLDLGRVLDAVARHLMRALQAHWCIISDWDPPTGRIGRLAEYRSAVWPPHDGRPLDLKTHPLHRRALQSGKPCTAAWDSAVDEAQRSSLAALSCRRLMVLPLQHEGRLVGLAELSNVHLAEPFGAPTVGQSVRAALDTAALLLSSRRMVEPKRLQESARHLLSAAGADWCTLYVGREQDPTSLTRLLAFGAGIWFEQGRPELDANRLPTLRIVLQEQRVAVLRATDELLHPQERALFDEVGVSALLALPLAFRGTTAGLVQLYDLNVNRTFSGREVAVARALANQAAVALENARLVRDLQRSLEQQAAMQGQLVRAARLSVLGELSAVIAHQINNPLTTILADAEMLVQDIGEDRPERTSAQAILRAGQRAKQVVERVLAMARGDDTISPLNINGTIRATLILLEPQITQNGITLEVDLAEGLPPVNSNPGQLEDIWMNLLINARDAIVQARVSRGAIRLQSSLSEDGKMVEVSVHDNGGGIPLEDQERVFDPFFTTKPRGKGTGLGLYICQQIVREHGGEIHLTSAPGVGTLVRVFLPAMNRAEGRRSNGDDPHRG